MLKTAKTVLVVDDDPQHLRATHDILSAEGYQVLTQDRPFGITNLIIRHKPDLVLLDVNMPGLSGDALALILSDNPLSASTRVVFHSSNDEDSLRLLTRKHSARGYICKGNPSDLRRKVAAFVA
jgi:twitching motility two-component system response regulator PilG